MKGKGQKKGKERTITKKGKKKDRKRKRIILQTNDNVLA